MVKGKKSATKKKAETEPSAEEEEPSEEPVEEKVEEITKPKPTEPAAKVPAKPTKAPTAKKTVKTEEAVEAAGPAKAAAPKKAVKHVKAEEAAPAKPAEAPKAAPAKPAPAKPAEAPKAVPAKPAEAPKKKKEITVSEIAEVETEKGAPAEKFEFEDKFNTDRAFEHVESLAFPRMVGTEGEQKAAEYIKNKFTDMKLKPIEEEFTFTNYASEFVIRAIHGIKGGLLILSLILFIFAESAGQIVAVCLSIALIVITFYSSIWARFFYRFQNSKGLLFKSMVKEYKSKNILAKIDCAGGKEKASGDIILLAHYDSKSQTFPELWRIVFYYISWVLNLILPILYISLSVVSFVTSAYLSSSLIILTILTIVALAAIGLLEINRNKNDSAGAINNASGLGVFLELANIYAKAPLENHNLTFVATGAEEMGLFGAISFIKAHEKEFNPDDTNFLNIKEVGIRGHFNIPGPIGFPPQLPCLEVENLVKKTLVRRKIPLKEGSKSLTKVISPWILTGSFNEDMIPIIRGFDANLISFGGYSIIPFLIEGTRKSHIIHTKKDTKDQVDKSALEIVGKVTAEVLKRMDIRGRT